MSVQKNTFMKASPASLMAGFALAVSAQGLQSGPIETLPVVLTPEQLQTVIIQDPNIFLNSGVDFTFGRSLGSMIRSKFGKAGDTQAARQAFLQTMITTFSATQATNPLSNITVILPPRPGEAALSPAAMLSTTDPLESMDLAAITFRFDLMPSDGSTCGEARQIFAKRSELTNTANRFLLIEEAALPNPVPSSGTAGCLPYAVFYKSLESQSGTQLAQSLEKFLYTGGAIDGVGPVVKAVNYGHQNGMGQIRVNMFDNAVPASPFVWQLRQFSVENNGSALSFAMQPVDDSPFTDLYRTPAIGEDPNLTNERPGFQNKFIANTMPALLKPELAAQKKQQQLVDNDLIFHMSTKVLSRYNSFQSTSSFIPNGDDMNTVDQNFLDRIQAAIPQTKLPYPITAREVVNRAGTQTCGGCHELSNGADIAPSVRFGQSFLWPNSKQFVHIELQPGVSQLLRDRFLPSRFANQEAFIASQGLMKPAFTTAADQASLAEIKELMVRGQASERDVSRAKPGFFGPRPTH